MQEFSAKSLLNEKDNYYLAEFIEILNKTFTIVMDEDSLAKVEEKTKNLDPKNNLLEGLTEMDLSYLKKFTYITCKEGYHEKDHVIHAVDYYALGENLKTRLQKLYELKKKWTKGELQTFLGEFLDDYKGDINHFIAKELKLVKQKNPFDQEKQIFYYQKKF